MRQDCFSNCFFKSYEPVSSDDDLIVRNIYIEKKFIVERIPGVPQEFMREGYLVTKLKMVLNENRRAIRNMFV